ncbi:hypothetical protein BWI96_06055 [Siphonobacter sp. SORGH_AS_0500]|nr:hypothetical protein BWI96_06055 [Siphonobacter sp. SORGH_AS_0500]
MVELFTPFGRATWILTELNPMNPVPFHEWIRGSLECPQ